ncbi:MAG: type II secretion system protein [Candidatus Gastranaerophilaceae bacterium]
MKNYSGFTLAEVLITLGIIGVVAALTMPSVINNYKEKETIAKLKRLILYYHRHILPLLTNTVLRMNGHGVRRSILSRKLWQDI